MSRLAKLRNFSTGGHGRQCDPVIAGLERLYLWPLKLETAVVGLQAFAPGDTYFGNWLGKLSLDISPQCSTKCKNRLKEETKIRSHFCRTLLSIP